MVARRDHREDEHRRDEEGRQFVRESLNSRPRTLNLPQPFDESVERAGRVGTDFDDDGVVGRDGAAEHGVAGTSRLGNRLARDERLVDGGAAVDNGPVHRNTFARSDENAVARYEVLDGNGLVVVVLDDAGGVVHVRAGQLGEAARGALLDAVLVVVPDGDHDDDGVWTHVYSTWTVTIVIVVTIGNYYEDRIKQRATSGLSELTSAHVDDATRIIEDDDHETVPVEDLVSGDRVLVRPGERVPVDGTVVDGSAAIDESLITGESIPKTRRSGDPVLGGTIASDNPIVVEVGTDATSTLDDSSNGCGRFRVRGREFSDSRTNWRPSSSRRCSSSRWSRRATTSSQVRRSPPPSSPVSPCSSSRVPVRWGWRRRWRSRRVGIEPIVYILGDSAEAVAEVARKIV
ncbi:hypothetical protein BG842_24210 [Haladaptatus sp. W1]|nr:hypothetical protein BG842_24210 [Haladaptatus sp. W1]